MSASCGDPDLDLDLECAEAEAYGEEPCEPGRGTNLPFTGDADFEPFMMSDPDPVPSDCAAPNNPVLLPPCDSGGPFTTNDAAAPFPFAVPTGDTFPLGLAGLRRTCALPGRLGGSCVNGAATALAAFGCSCCAWCACACGWACG